MPHCLETRRLLLRGICTEDMPFLVDLLGHSRITRWLFSGTAMGPDSAKSFIEENFTFGEQEIGLGSLYEKNPRRIIGFAGILPCRYLGVDDFEFGLALEEGSHGKGYAEEISLAQIEHGLARLPVDRMLALVHPRNGAALKAVAKMGLHFIEEVVTEQRGPRCVFST